MCAEILQLYSSQYSSESLAMKILLSTTGLLRPLKSHLSLFQVGRLFQGENPKSEPYPWSWLTDQEP